MIAVVMRDQYCRQSRWVDAEIGKSHHGASTGIDLDGTCSVCTSTPGPARPGTSIGVPVPVSVTVVVMREGRWCVSDVTGRAAG